MEKRGVTEAVILCGGKGLRLMPLTIDKPKIMVEYKGKTIGEHIIEWLKAGGITHVIFSTDAANGAKLKEYFGKDGRGLGVSCSYNIEKKKLGTGGGIKDAARLRKDKTADFLAMNGDIITDAELREIIGFHSEKKKANGTIATIALVNQRNPYGVVYLDNDGVCHSFEEKPLLQGVWINAGIYLFDGKRMIKYLPIEGDIERECFPNLARKHLLAGYKIEHHKSWKAIDSIKDLQN